MLISALVLIIFAVVCLYFNYKNKYAYAVMLQLVCISVAVFVALSYMAKMFPYTYFFNLDYQMYLLFREMRLSIYGMCRIYNSCFVLMMVNSLLSLRLVKKMNLPLLIIGIGFIAFFMVWLDPYVCYLMYIYSVTTEIAQKLVADINIIVELIFEIFILIPPVMLGIFAFKTRAKTKKRAMLIFGGCFAIMDIFVYYIFIGGAFRNIWFKGLNAARLPVIGIDSGEYINVIKAMTILFVAIAALLVFYQPFGIFSARQRRRAIKNAKMFNTNLSMQMHVYKNAFLAIGQQFSLIQMNSARGDMECVHQSIDIGETIVEENIKLIAHTLKMLRADAELFMPVSLIHCVNNALNNTSMNSVAIVDNRLIGGDGVICANEYNLTEAFVNILINAAEAVKKTDRQPKIRIVISEEDDSSYILEFIDNGIGIPKKDLINIFKPFFSTKPPIKCGGIGLSYVKNMVESCGGFISVVSKLGEGTNFQIMFPKYKEHGGNQL